MISVIFNVEQMCADYNLMKRHCQDFNQNIVEVLTEETGIHLMNLY